MVRPTCERGESIDWACMVLRLVYALERPSAAVRAERRSTHYALITPAVAIYVLPSDLNTCTHLMKSVIAPCTSMMGVTLATF